MSAKTGKRDTQATDAKYLGYLSVYAADHANLTVVAPPKPVKVPKAKKAPKAKVAPKAKAAKRPAKGTGSPRGAPKKTVTLADRHAAAKGKGKYVSVNKVSSTIGRGNAGREFAAASLPFVVGSEKATKNKFVVGVYVAADSAELFGRAVDRLVEEKALTEKQGVSAKKKFAKKYPAKDVAKKSPARKAAKKSPARKSPAKKAAKKSPARKSPAKKTARKSPVRKSPVRKSPARRRSSGSSGLLPDISPPGSPASQAALPSTRGLGRASPSPSRLVGGIPPVTRTGRGRVAAPRSSPGRKRVTPSRVSVSPRARSRSPVLGSGDAPPLAIPQ